MKKLLATVFVMMLVNVSAAIAGPIDWVRETFFPVQIIERVVEKIIPVVSPPPTGWIIWSILIGIVMLLLRGSKVSQAILRRMPVFPKRQ